MYTTEVTLSFLLSFGTASVGYIFEARPLLIRKDKKFYRVHRRRAWGINDTENEPQGIQILNFEKKMCTGPLLCWFLKEGWTNT